MSFASPRSSRRLPIPTPVQRWGLLLGVFAFVAALLVEIPGLEPAGQRMLAIFLLAILLWVTEAIPLYATAALVILLEVLMLSDQALMATAGKLPPAASYFAALANPVIMLFLGGFLIADGAHKYGLDRSLAAIMLRPFAGNARRSLLGLMTITALLSMFVSNTATTATMFAVVIPILAALPGGRARTGVALAIPVAANIGGIGTPVGTPPNAIALAALQAQGQGVSFIGWMALAVPLMLILLLFAWWFLAYRYVPKDASLGLELDADFDRSPAAILFYVIAGTTILLWLTEPLHGISSSTVGFMPVVALLATQVMGADDLRRLQWPVLWLVAGGIALGTGIGYSGLDVWLIGLVAWETLPLALLLLLLVAIAVGLATVISHSATANLLVPLALSLAVGLPIDTTAVGVMVALACSLAMALPISTPPNALAYATGEVPTSEMILSGIVIGGFGALLLALLMPTVWGALGLL
ncbi:SLC13 family permease [Thiobaca trueperi]|uniref:Sodium-dependent dicarboxylate transporter 2/3/5 n=1 Tax=Thiobaca trueperi TaxID=127458 RepID=A0A4R3N3B7_9GAMM|nr:DASS family sodium-coupled anion symporter [Thiobaca trueperi]TCT21563.1 sodium-dependent dicarboxylate transporter 2/3/5 [Thiobaca trueperi]